MVGELQKSGNLTGLFMAEEESLGVLPASPKWYEREPNSYSDFGGDFAMSTRTFITHDRQHGRGEVADNNPTGGFQEDFTLTNMVNPMQAFLFADAHEKPSTAPLNGSAVVITGAVAADDQYTAASGLGSFLVGHIVYASGFGVTDNNGINRVTTVAAGALTMASPLEDEASPPAGAFLQAVGFQFGSADLTLTLFDDRVVLTTTAGDFTTLGLIAGEWIGVGGDSTTTRFADTGANAPFWGQIDAIAAKTLTLRKTSGVQETNAGTGKTIQIWFGTVIKNEDDCEIIKQRSYTLERQYGCGDDAEAEYVGGAVANQITVTVPTPAADAKVTVDLAFIGCVSYERTVEDGGPLTSGTRIAGFNEPAFKPGLDVYEHKLAVVDPTELNPTKLVAYNSQASLVVNNNLGGNKAIEVFGNSGINIGEFTVSGNLTAYFPGVVVARKVRQGAELTWHLILTKANAAVIMDIASIGLGGARASVEANAAVTLPLDTAAGKGKYGYTLLTNFFRYAPAALMAQ